MKIEEIAEDVIDGNDALTTEDLTAEQSLSLGDSLFVDEMFAEAADVYAAALLVLREDSPMASALTIRILSHRSAAYYRLRRYQDALDDALEAMAVWSKAKGGGITGLRPMESEVCHKRAGVAAMNLQDYKRAKDWFEKAQQLATLNRGDEKTYKSYIKQCEYNLKPKASPSPMMDMGDLPAPSSAASASVASSNSTMKKKTSTTPSGTPAKPAAKKPKPAPAAPKPSSNSGSANVSTTTTSNKKIPVTSVPKYQYYQNDKFVTIAVLESNVKAEHLDVLYEPNHVTVRLAKNGVTHTVVCGNTYAEVDVDGCKTNIKDEKVLVKLKKKEVGFEWPELLGKKIFGSSSTSRPPASTATAATGEGESKQDEDGEETKPAAAAAIPTIAEGKPRPYASHKDWDKIEKELADAEKDEKPEGDEAMNKLFQTIYASADEDTKRAMIKSYQTSGGTVLSTNWGEVKEKDYEAERTAPKGMEWKTYNGEKLPMKEDD